MPRKEIRVEARLKNNVLYHAIYDRWPSVSQFCREQGFNIAQILSFLNLRLLPLNKKGDFLPICQRLAKKLGFLVEDLFPLKLYKIKQTKAVIEVSFSELPAPRILAQLPAPENPEQEAINEELREEIFQVLHQLPPREQFVIEERFLRDKTLEEVAGTLNVCRDRVRQIENKALRRLRHPAIAKKLKPFIQP